MRRPLLVLALVLLCIPLIGQYPNEGILTANKVFNVRWYGATGDGATDDSTAMRAALTACDTNGGGTVYVPAGTYMVDENGATFRALDLYENCRLTGDGPNSIIRMIAGQGNDVRTIYTEDAVYGMEIDHLALDGNGPNQPGCDEHCAGIFVNNSVGVNIHHLEIHEYVGDGISIFGTGGATFASNINIADNYIHDNDRSAIVPGASKYVTITRNRLDISDAVGANNNCVDYEADVAPAAGETWGPYIITNNTCILAFESTDDGFQMSSNHPAYVVIANNSVESGNVGIYIGCGISGIVANNFVRNPDNYGVRVTCTAHDVEVIGNFIDMSGAVTWLAAGSGIIVEAASGTPTRVTVADNILIGDDSSDYEGIRIRSVTDIQVRGNQVSDFKTGIQVWTAVAANHSVVVENNTITDFEDAILYYEGAAGTPVYSRLIFRNNNISGGTWDGVQSVNGIQLFGPVDYPWIINNVFTGLSGLNIAYSSGPDGYVAEILNAANVRFQDTDAGVCDLTAYAAGDECYDVNGDIFIWTGAVWTLMVPGPYHCASTAGVDAYTCVSGMRAYYAGLTITLNPDVNNVGACSVNVDALGITAIQVLTAGAKANPANDDIDADFMYILIFDGTDFLLVDPS